MEEIYVSHNSGVVVNGGLMYINRSGESIMGLNHQREVRACGQTEAQAIYPCCPSSPTNAQRKRERGGRGVRAREQASGGFISCSKEFTWEHRALGHFPIFFPPALFRGLSSSLFTPPYLHSSLFWNMWFGRQSSFINFWFGYSMFLATHLRAIINALECWQNIQTCRQSMMSSRWGKIWQAARLWEHGAHWFWQRERNREKEGAQERDNKNSESGAQKLRKILFFPLSLVPCTPEIPHIFQIPKAFTM